MIPKKLAVISDFTGFGRCSLSISLPVISALKVQACPVPTFVFSNHTGFSDWYCMDFTDHIPSYLAKWNTLGIEFDGIYCGYLGNQKQIDYISEFLQIQDSKIPVLIDPIMGDHGKLYSGFSSIHCERMKNFIKHAHILTPNLTEACLLTDTKFDFTLTDSPKILDIIDKLHKMGPKQIVITGIQKENYFYNYISDKPNNISTIYKTPVTGHSRPGTGDLFASIISANYLKGDSFSLAVQKAADFVSICIEGTEKECTPIQEGVCFENYLSLLSSL